VDDHECHRLFELVAPEHLVSADAIEDACLGEADVLVTAFDGVELVFEDATGSVGDALLLGFKGSRQVAVVEPIANGAVVRRAFIGEALP